MNTGAIARWVDATCDGPEDREITGLGSLAHATGVDLSFCSGGRWLKALEHTRAGAVFVRDRVPCPDGVVALRHPNPRLAYALAAARILPLEWPEPGIHPTASIHPSSEVEGACIGPFAVVSAHAVVEPGAWIDAHAYIGAHTRIGSRSRVMPHAVVMERCTLGERVWLHPGAVIGADGFGHVPGPQGVVRVPQVGTVVLEDDVEVGSNACVDRAALDETRIGQASRLDNLVQVAHGVQIGKECLLAAFSGVAGGARLGARVVMGGRTAVVDGIEVGDDVLFAGLASASRDVPNNTRLGGSPARRYNLWLREVAALRQLPQLIRVVERLRRKVESAGETK